MKSASNSVPAGAAGIPAPFRTKSLLMKIYECVPSLNEINDPEPVILPCSYEHLIAMRDACNELLDMGKVSFEVHCECYCDLQDAASDKTIIDPSTLSCGCYECLHKALNIKYEIDLARCGRSVVYLMRNERNGYFKIGFTRRPPEFRERTLQSEEPDVRLICTWPGTPLDEKKLHKRYAHRRLRGEWFALTYKEFYELSQMEFGHGLNTSVHPQDGSVQ